MIPLSLAGLPTLALSAGFWRAGLADRDAVEGRCQNSGHEAKLAPHNRLAGGQTVVDRGRYSGLQVIPSAAPGGVKISS